MSSHRRPILVAIFAASSMATSAMSAAQVEDIVDKQVLVVFDVARTPAKATEIARGDLASPGVLEALATIGPAISLRKLLSDDLVDVNPDAATRVAMRESPELVLSNYLVATFDSASEANNALSRLRVSPLVRAITESGVRQ